MENDLKELIEVSSRKAMACVAERKFETAVIHFDNWIAAEPDNANARAGIAEALISIGKIDEANSHLLKIVEIDPGSYKTRMRLAGNYESLGKAHQAVYHARECISRSPKREEPYLLLARVVYRKKYFKAALEVLDEGLKQVGDKAPLQLMAAEIALKAGEYEVCDERSIMAYENILKDRPKLFERVERSLSIESDDMIAMMAVRPQALWPKIWLDMFYQSPVEQLARLTPQLLLQSIPLSAKIVCVASDAVSSIKKDMENLAAARGMEVAQLPTIADARDMIYKNEYAGSRILVDLSADQVGAAEIKILDDVFRKATWLLIDCRRSTLSERFNIISLLQSRKIDYKSHGSYIIGNNSHYLENNTTHHKDVNRLPLPKNPDFYMDDDETINFIRRAIDAKNSFSLIRLGDGEGWVLGYRDTSLQAEVDRITSFWFGDRKISPHDMQHIRCNLINSIRNADVVGMNFEDKINAPFGMPRRHFNEYQLWNGTTKFCAHMMHHHAWLDGKFDIIFNKLDYIGLVTSRLIENFVQERFQVKQVVTYLIPEEVRYAEDREKVDPHYPDAFERISEQITVPYQGAVFLVGAGVLGKLYCDTIKRKGGIALDIGGVFDIWAGHKRVAGALDKIKSQMKAT